MRCSLKYFGCDLSALFNRVIFVLIRLFVFWRSQILRSFLEETYESGDDIEENSDELGSESGSFGTTGTCSGVPLFDLTVYEGVKFYRNL